MWGILLITSPSVREYAIVGGASAIGDLSNSNYFSGFILIFFAIIALFGIFTEKRFHPLVSLLLVMPQYLILFSSIIIDTFIFITGEYKGEPVPYTISLAFLFPIYLGAILHTCAIVERYILRWIRG